MAEPAQLTSRQAAFAEAYAHGGCGTRAVRAAGYASNSTKAMSVQACRLLADDRVVAAIEHYRREQARKLDIRLEHLANGLWAAYEQARGQSNPALMILAMRVLGEIGGFYPTGQSRGIARDLRRAAGRRAAPRRKDLLEMSDAELLDLAEGDPVLEGEPVVANGT